MSDETNYAKSPANYAKSPADIRSTAENIAENYAFNPNILAGAICSALVIERERCATIAADHHVATVGSPSRYTQGFSAACEVIAQAIRSSHE